jgi:hypothetical protein
MKWSRMWVVAPLVAGLALACGDDVAVEDLVGTWNATEFVFSDFGDPVTDFDVLAMGGAVSIVIEADGTYTITFTMPESEPEVDTGTWDLDGDVLTFDAGTIDETAFELSLSGDTFTIHSEDVTFDFDEDGTEDAAQLDATFVRD